MYMFVCVCVNVCANVCVRMCMCVYVCGTDYGDIYYKYLLESIVRVEYCIPVLDFNQVLMAVGTGGGDCPQYFPNQKD